MYEWMYLCVSASRFSRFLIDYRYDLATILYVPRVPLPCKHVYSYFCNNRLMGKKPNCLRCALSFCYYSFALCMPVMALKSRICHKSIKVTCYL